MADRPEENAFMPEVATNDLNSTDSAIIGMQYEADILEEAAVRADLIAGFEAALKNATDPLDRLDIAKNISALEAGETDASVGDVFTKKIN